MLRASLILNDTLLREAQRLTGLGEKTAIVHAGSTSHPRSEPPNRSIAALGGWFAGALFIPAAAGRRLKLVR